MLFLPLTDIIEVAEKNPNNPEAERQKAIHGYQDTGSYMLPKNVNFFNSPLFGFLCLLALAWFFIKQSGFREKRGLPSGWDVWVKSSAWRRKFFGKRFVWEKLTRFFYNPTQKNHFLAHFKGLLFTCVRVSPRLLGIPFQVAVSLATARMTFEFGLHRSPSFFSFFFSSTCGHIIIRI